MCARLKPSPLFRLPLFSAKLFALRVSALSFSFFPLPPLLKLTRAALCVNLISMPVKNHLSFLALCLALSVPAILPAQGENTTTVSIRVADQSGAVVAHAKIRLAPLPKSAPAILETNERGELTLPLKVGSYALFVELPGFKTNVSHVEVEAAKTVQTVPVVLQIGPTGSPMVWADSAKEQLLLSAFPYHNPVIMSRTELKSLPRTTVTVQNTHNNTQEVYSGVRVADLFTKLGAPLGSELRGKAMVNYIRASGSDGYQVIFSAAEIDPSFHSGEIIVADEMNGQPLDAKSGPFKLVASDDKRPARWVRNLSSLELKAAE
jgi:hypothetical protein